MAPKSTPFKIVVHFAGQKSQSEIQKLYTDFYLDAVKDTLTNSNLTEESKRDVMERLLAHFENPSE